MIATFHSDDNAHSNMHIFMCSKRTITPTKKVTKEDYQKSKEDIEEIFGLFRDFVKENRPKLDIDKVATGETWFGTAALERKLCMCRARQSIVYLNRWSH